MLAKSKIISIIIISICAVLAVILGCVFGINNTSPKTDLNTSINALSYDSGVYTYTYTAGSGICSIGRNYNNKPSGSITLPSSVTIDGVSYKVTEVKESGFWNCDDLTRVTIPSSITTLNSSAFSSCDALTKATIGSGVQTIIGNIFNSCDELSTISVDSSNKYFCIYNGALMDINKTRIIAYPIGGYLSSFTIPSTVNTIESSVFYNCDYLTTVTISGTGAMTIKSNAFYSCDNMANLYLASWKSLLNITFVNDGAHPFERADAGAVYVNNVLQTSVTIPSSFTKINDYTFLNCTGITSVTIPSSVTSIGTKAFADCTGIANVYYNGTLENWLNMDLAEYSSNPLHQGANFYISSSKVTSITIPSTILDIQDNVLYGCESLTSLIIQANVTRIGLNAFRACLNLATVTIQSEKINFIGQYAFYNTAWLTDLQANSSGIAKMSNGETRYAISIPVAAISVDMLNVKTIAEYAFYNCTALTTINLPQSITNIGRYAFYGCTKLATISMNANITKICERTFYNCTNLLSITIPQSVNLIENYAFYNCTVLNEINFNAIAVSDLVFSNYVFYQAGQSAGGITLNIGKDVTRIPSYMFCPCSSSSCVPEIKNINFESGSNCAYIGEYAFAYCDVVSEINLPDNITAIDNYAFYYCIGLTDVTIGNKVGSIGSYAFRYCSALARVYFRQTTNFTMSSYAFKDGLSSVIYYFVSQDVLNNTKSKYASTSYVSNTSNFQLSHYAVIFETNGGSNCDIIYVELQNSTYGELPVPEKEDNVFVGWYKSVDLSGELVSENDSVTSTHTLYAKWRPLCKILIIAGEGGIVSDENFVLDIGEMIKVSAIVSPGKAFLYWVRASDGAKIVENPLKQVVSQDETYTAVFGASFEGIAVTSTIGGVAYIVGDKFDELSNTDTITFATKQCVAGYSFSHWEDMNGNNLGTEMSIRLQKSLVMDNVITAVYVENANSSINNDLNN